MDGVVYTFAQSGLYNGLFVMSDRQTDSVWTHYDGTVLKGPLAGQGIALEIEPMAHTTWGRWVSDHPDTLVLDWIEQYEDEYGPGGFGDENIGRSWLGPQFRATVVADLDDRLRGNQLVLGAGIGDDFSAYPLDDVEGVTAINDVLDDHPVVVVLDPDNLFGLAYSAVVNGETREFAVDAGVIVDDEGTTWSLEGKAMSGPSAGESLEFVTSFVTEWYGWAAYHPETTIHGHTD